MTDRNIIHTAPGDTLVTDDEWAWIADLYGEYPEDPTEDQHCEIDVRLKQRFGTEKTEEMYAWSRTIPKEA